MIDNIYDDKLLKITFFNESQSIVKQLLEKMIAKNWVEKMMIMIFGKSVPIFKLLRVTLLEVFPDLSTKIFVLCLTIQILENASFLLCFDINTMLVTQHTSLNIQSTVLILIQKFHQFSWEMCMFQKIAQNHFFHMNPNPQSQKYWQKNWLPRIVKKKMLMIFCKSVLIFKGAPNHFLGKFPT